MQFPTLNSILVAALAATASAAPRHEARQFGTSALNLFLHQSLADCGLQNDFLRLSVTEICQPLPQGVSFAAFDFDELALADPTNCRVVFSSSPTCGSADSVFNVVAQECHDAAQFGVGSALRFVNIFCS